SIRHEMPRYIGGHSLKRVNTKDLYSAATQIWGCYRLASRAKVYREPAVMSTSDSTVMYTSVSSKDVPFWGIRFFGMEQPNSPEATPQSHIQTPPVPQDEDEQEDPEEYEDEEIEDGLIDYPMDGGDDGYDDDRDSSRDDTNDEEEEEEHLALANSAIVIPTDELVSPPEGTKPAAISFPPEAEVERLLAMPTPSPSPLTSLSSPSVGERTLRLAFTQALIDAVTATIPSPLLPPPLYIPPSVDHRDDGPRSRFHPTRGIGEVGYGIRDTWVDPAEMVPEIAPMTVGEVNT
nr:hypothetical protein [Tanacetum cinerariifolium]